MNKVTMVNVDYNWLRLNNHNRTIDRIRNALWIIATELHGKILLANKFKF